MSHLPASKMPDAASHQHDAEEASRDQAATMEPSATAFAATAAQRQTPVQPAPKTKAMPTRSGWAVEALAAGGVALAAVAIGVAIRCRGNR